jgi:DNA-binding XRE family transcriptional regulator
MTGRPLGYLADQLAKGLVASRERAGKSRRAFADEHGVSHMTLRELEVGLANPTLKRVEEVAAMYGAEVELRIRLPRTRKARP